ncbi:MAG: beta-ketoacyl synthase N-terminal-like domain-containing protein [Opitutus sp.]
MAPLPPVRLAAAGCITALGNAQETHAALLRGERALQLSASLGADGGENVPLALTKNRSLDETAPPNWLASVKALASELQHDDWGGPRTPVFVTSSNFGVGSLYAFRQHGNEAHLAYGTPHRSVEWLATELGWGANVATVSHACVSAHLGLLLATRSLQAGLADRALVFSFDFISPFVAGGFHALKILNAGFPAPYADRPTGSIGLGDGAAFAVLTRDEGDFTIAGQSLYNEMHHFTANRADGTGFAACLAPLREAVNGRRLWLKGHGTGTLEAGKLEATALATAFPHAPLVGWKGSLGHTLGSCGLVELAIACAAMRDGRAPGTIGSAEPVFHPALSLDPLSLAETDGVICSSNAFGGAHAAFLLTHD